MADKYAHGNPAVAELIGWYADEARFDNEEPAAAVLWAYGRYSDGTPIPASHRKLYRARPDLQAAFPDPFDASSSGLKGWMEQQGPLEHPELLGAKKRSG
jgi:hypothetical protein